MSTFLNRAALLAVLALVAATAPAEEGMWTFDDPPRALLEEKHGFTPTSDWLDQLRLASVRFMDGGSGSFVSADGLMITNHHVGLGCIQNVSSAENDYVRDGFRAESREAEIACPGYEVNVLVGSEDATAKVLGAVTPAMTDAEARQARRATSAGLENECSEKTGLRCNVVELYDGGQYWLYRYKKYTDVRLVFAPEEQTAAFGGDPDNFTFPRHDLDVSFMRAYEDAEPVRSSAHLGWSQKGADEGDLVFVSGNPGSTARLETMARLEYLRDAAIPFHLKRLRRRLDVLRGYGKLGEEQNRRALEQIRGYENSIKAYDGFVTALGDAAAMAARSEREEAFRSKVAADAALSESVGDPWDSLARIYTKLGDRAMELRLVTFRGSRLLQIAGEIVQYVAEVEKPNAERYAEFVDARLDSLRNELFSSAPIHDDLETATLADELELARESLGADHPFVMAVLDGQTPSEAARAAVAGTALEDPAVREKLVEGGEAAVAASKDPMIALARRIDPHVREVRAFEEDEVEAPRTRAKEALSRARWKVYGKTLAPDATFTLRLTYGTVKGFPAEGTWVAPFTTFYGLFDRSIAHGGKHPWDLTPRWGGPPEGLDLSTPLNFVSTNDTTGGNSGSPVVDRKGEFVGIVFDGNIHSLAWRYYFSDERARTVSVDARGILEALKKVYRAEALVEELLAP
jgi:hypothetical protein